MIYADTVGDLGYAEELGNYGEYSGGPNQQVSAVGVALCKRSSGSGGGAVQAFEWKWGWRCASVRVEGELGSLGSEPSRGWANRPGDCTHANSCTCACLPIYCRRPTTMPRQCWRWPLRTQASWQPVGVNACRCMGTSTAANPPSLARTLMCSLFSTSSTNPCPAPLLSALQMGGHVR